MLLPRRYYLAMAGVDTQLFKTLQRRNQVPLFANMVRYEGESSKPEDVLNKADINGYSPVDSIMLAVADKLVTSNSFTRDSAKAFVQSRPELIVEAIKRVEAGENLWIAGSTFGHKAKRVTRSKGGEITGYVPSFAQIGTISEVTKLVEIHAEKHGWKLAAINLLCVTQIIQDAKMVANEIGLEGSLLVKN